ncbi:MAG: GntR family transcriptional regulator [Chitinivibrionales bacterium]|nr:GntR family transcriptional regulator [Chitinivibrionales bacterium]
MNKSLTKPMQSALRCLTEEISRTAPGESLSKSTQLAARAHVSSVTMLKALALLKSKGYIDRKPGKPYHVINNALRLDAILPERPTVTPLTWQRIKTSLQSDIIQGVIGAEGRLPNMKELQSIYTCDYRTLRKALASLIEDGIVECDGKRLMTHRIGGSSSGGKIIFIGYRMRHSENLQLSSFQQSCLAVVEELCVKGRISLETQTLPQQLTSEQYQNEIQTLSQVVARDADLLGFIVFLTLNYKVDRQIISMLVRFNKPLAVLQDQDIFSRAIFKPFSNIRIFAPSFSERAGYITGQYLIAKNHHKAAYISIFHNLDWSTTRLDGLQRAFREIDRGDATVTPFLFDRHARGTEFAEAGDRRWGTFSIRKELEIWKDRFPPNTHNKIDAFIEGVAGNTAFAECIYQSEKLFDEALKDENITVWVCANDMLAFIARDYLMRKAIKISDDISLLGFDNTPECLQYHLTSYNFNFPAAGYGMFDYITRPYSFLAHHKNQVIDIEGHIVERKSVATLE